MDQDTWDSDIEDVLKLNSKHLRRLRQAAWKAATADLSGDLSADLSTGRRRGRRQPRDWRMGDIQQVRDQLRARSQLVDYQPLIEDWLDERLRRAQPVRGR